MEPRLVTVSLTVQEAKELAIAAKAGVAGAFVDREKVAETITLLLAEARRVEEDPLTGA